MIGDRFSRWTVMADHGRFWTVRCDCGTERKLRAFHVQNGHTKSCGCLARDIARTRSRANQTTHGLHDTPAYQIWIAMKSRCSNPLVSGYERYGGRGITVCEEWRESFEAFFHDMGPRPPGMSLDRRDTNGPYCKENCRWATPKQQSRNMRRNRLVTISGETMTMVEAAERYGADYAKVKSRMHRGWSIERALGFVGAP